MKMRLSALIGAAVLVGLWLLMVPASLQGENTDAGGVLYTPPQSSQAIAPSATIENLSRMPLAFTENRGQWDERVRFRASAGGAILWFCRDGITYQFTHRVPRSKTAGGDLMAAGIGPRAPFDRTEPDSIESVVVHAAFVGNNPDVELAGENLLDYRCNYFLGNDPTKWRTDVPNYTTVMYRGVYPGVDLRYDGSGGVLTCAYTAASESDLAQVKFRYEGFDSAHPRGNAAVTKTGRGEFRVEAPWGAVFEPLSWGAFAWRAGSVPPAVGLAPVAAGTSPVSLVYSTYLGGSGADLGFGIAVDSSGCAYVSGCTMSADFPTLDPYQSDQPDQDVFVTKLSSDGNALVYSTYLGGSGRDGSQDEGNGIAVDQAGNAYVTGYTYSSDFPTANPYQTDQEEADVFVTKLSSAGNVIIPRFC